ncbi:uncharacterized protein PGTG_20568 [Puccinia graminis f. sp. tritici CRL 75-36-700-3]|uniref:Uncharacterized protein n=1 Tax=Puccinia graminis f. sp. tritici (strain CRL 75-36-700-3 / race SCCL) TaxID=418459 RepID=H6QNX2_PUCGT|nr:uncharacterized protein PGTG_20568 [Puccinia graminis f. sp. tritici CRL 75-36-700-3]EHS62442.1 hypothetical protein PGTG_20568 [Puccinia graminis f. sp. tritici CRL 75-36-700-3]
MTPSQVFLNSSRIPSDMRDITSRSWSMQMLAGIVEAPANYRYLPETAPTLTQLILLVHRNFMPSLEKRSDEAIIKELPDTTAVRFTYLRFQLARHRFQANGQNRRITNWEMIDRDLETLRSKSSGYQVAHTQLIAEKEKRLWGRRIGEFQASDFEMPTVTEINNRIAESARND